MGGSVSRPVACAAADASIRPAPAGRGPPFSGLPSGGTPAL